MKKPLQHIPPPVTPCSIQAKVHIHMLRNTDTAVCVCEAHSTRVADADLVCPLRIYRIVPTEPRPSLSMCDVQCLQCIVAYVLCFIKRIKTLLVLL